MAKRREGDGGSATGVAAADCGYTGAVLRVGAEAANCCNGSAHHGIHRTVHRHMICCRVLYGCPRQRNTLCADAVDPQVARRMEAVVDEHAQTVDSHGIYREVVSPPQRHTCSVGSHAAEAYCVATAGNAHGGHVGYRGEEAVGQITHCQGTSVD